MTSASTTCRQSGLRTTTSHRRVLPQSATATCDRFDVPHPPAGTAPNALVFASGRVTMRQMMRAGFLLDLACAALIPPLVVVLLNAGLLPGT